MLGYDKKRMSETWKVVFRSTIILYSLLKSDHLRREISSVNYREEFHLKSSGTTLRSLAGVKPIILGSRIKLRSNALRKNKKKSY